MRSPAREILDRRTDKGRLTPDQSRVLSLLHDIFERPGRREWANVYVWRPSMWNEIEATLTFKEDRAA